MAIRTEFLPILLGGTAPTTTTPELCSLLALPVKAAGIGVPDPTSTADIHYSTSTVCSTTLANSLSDHTPLTIVTH